jgi:inorganic pyrophosphatase
MDNLTYKILIEIPKGTVNKKFEYDHKTKKMVLDFVFENLVWPYNYGEMVGTLGGDGDALDAVVFSSKPLEQSAIVDCIPFGGAHVIDREEVDDKLLFVPVGDALAEKYKDISDFSEADRKMVVDLWMEIARQKKKIMEVKGFMDKQWALRLIEKSLI